MQRCKAASVSELTSLWQLLRGAFGAGDGQRAPRSRDEGVKTQLAVTKTNTILPETNLEDVRPHPEMSLIFNPSFWRCYVFV